MRRILLLMSVLCVALPSFGQTKHPFTFEDMMALKRVEEPVPSPDGKWVLFAAVDVDLKANTKTPHVWVVPLSQATAGSSPSQDNLPSANHPASVGMTGSGEREIISDQDADRPRWAPDGKRFAFVSSKEGGSQIWIADFDGATGTVTAKHRLTNIATGASGELWSPDGQNILFTSDVYPECDGAPAAEADCNAKTLDEVKNSKVRALIFTHLMYRHWTAYKAGKRTHIFVVAAPSIAQPGEGTGAGHGLGAVVAARDLTPGDYDAPPFSLGGQDDYAFSPDGQEICFSSNHDPVEAISTNKDLFTVPVNFPSDASSAQVLAATKNITADNKAADETPLYSPDGKYIAYRAQWRPGDESDRWGLAIYARKYKASRIVTGDFDKWVGTMAWSPDSKYIYFSFEDKGRSPIYEVSIAFTDAGAVASPPSELFSGFNDDLAVAHDGRTLFYTQMSIGSPTEIYSGNIVPPKEGNGLIEGDEICDGKNLKDCRALEPVGSPLTHINHPILSQIVMQPLESFWFKGANNDKVQGFLVKPPNFDPGKKYPVKFLIHGGPEGAWGDDWSYRWNPELFAANGYVVIMINFHGSTGYGQKFIDAINGDWGGAPFEDLMRGLDYAEQHYPFIDKTRECALGASYGGYMANWILGHTDRFKCIVSHDGMFNSESAWGDTEELWFNEWEFKGTPYTNREMYRKWSPHLSAANFKTPTLVIHSQLDYRLDVSEGLQLFTTLQRQEVPSKMLYFPDEGHWILKPQNSQLWYKTVNDWVDQWAK
jgi:dipeptidyl aminopeptidase/acylaminoacyl peptidase